ncbi:MAG: hypothetical protein RR636_11355 [Clostridium sp.]|uniref:hypothetical protein n=1 Tax=Clostridium sp. TaxID=1506 RepID=UPI00303FAA20
MSLYFGDLISSISTLLLVVVFVYMGLSIAKHKEIEKWGNRVAILIVWGLLICIFVAIRDSYHLSVQATMDTSIIAGVFTLRSIQSKLCCIAGAVIGCCFLSLIFIKNEKYRKNIFFILSAVILFKFFIIEISRIT